MCVLITIINSNSNIDFIVVAIVSVSYYRAATNIAAIQSAIHFEMGKITIYIHGRSIVPVTVSVWVCVCLGFVCASVIVIQRKLNYFLRLHLSLNLLYAACVHCTG